MAQSTKSRVNNNIDFGDAHVQQQSPLFTMLPLDIRRHIYLQIWRGYGTTQHIYLFGPNSYLSHYPCLLEKDAFNHHRPPAPSLPPSESQNSAVAAAETGSQDIGNNNLPESYDDPGDIDGAIQDLAAPQPQSLPDAISGFGDGLLHKWDGSPWCMHKKCFQAYIQTFDFSFERGYSRNYRRASRSPTGKVGITKPLLVCKRMYAEASESLYSKIAFSFPDMSVLERFLNDVPRVLRMRIPVIYVSDTVSSEGPSLGYIADWHLIKIVTTILAAEEPSRNRWGDDSLGIPLSTSLPSLSSFCMKLKTLLSNVQGKSKPKNKHSFWNVLIVPEQKFMYVCISQETLG